AWPATAVPPRPHVPPRPPAPAVLPELPHAESRANARSDAQRARKQVDSRIICSRSGCPSGERNRQTQTGPEEGSGRAMSKWPSPHDFEVTHHPGGVVLEDVAVVHPLPGPIVGAEGDRQALLGGD